MTRVLAWALLWLLAASASAQDPDTSTGVGVAAPAAGPLPAPVILGGDSLFLIVAPMGAFTPAERAAAIAERLARLARDPTARVSDVRVLSGSESSDVIAGDVIVTSVTPADAEAAGIPRDSLARLRGLAVRAALQEHAVAANYRVIGLGLLYAALATILLRYLLRGIADFFARARRLVRRWRSTHFQSLRVQNLQLVSGERLAALADTLLRTLRVALLALAIYLYLMLVLGFFPWTRGIAARLKDYIVEPVAAAGTALVEYLPHLFYLAVIIVVTAYALKLIRLVFDGVERGAVTFSGFYPDWADPTYKLVRFLVIALAVVVAWPHLPRSDSAEFKGVAAFLGLLFSLGAASAVANVVGGTLLVYMRPFRVGDRVRIAETEGDVIERSLLATRIRTPKNVEITVPNAMVLGSHIINFNAAAADGGLVLHTTITIGYDAPWRDVQAALLEAAARTEGLEAEPAPYVLQTALSDFYVAYELNAFTNDPNTMQRTYSRLHGHIQDTFNEAGIEITSPHFAAHRDGNTTTIPPAYRPAGYRPGGFRLEGDGSAGAAESAGADASS